MSDLFHTSGAVIDGQYRYLLWRTWDESRPLVLFVGLNPSTADAHADDPTIRREISFARNWGYGGLLKCNLYALRSTDPKGLLSVADPVGPENDRHLREAAGRAARIICAWGSHFQKRPKRGGFTAADRALEVKALLEEAGKGLYCIAAQNAIPPAIPPHPLYLSASMQPIRWGCRT